MTAAQKQLMHQRFGGATAESLAHMTSYPHGADFPPNVHAYGPARMRMSTSGPSRDQATFFNQEVHHDYLCLNQRGARAYGSAADAAQAEDALFFATSTDLTKTLVVRDAMVLTDRYTRYVAVTLVSSHDETAAALELYFQRHGVPLTLASDGEPANHSAEVRALCATYGVAFTRRNAPYHPHHNATVETSIGLLKQKTAALLASAQLPPTHHWPDALLHAAAVLNVTPRRSLQWRSSYELVHGRAPDLRHFRRYGCVAWVLKLGSTKDKGGFLNANHIECMYIGVGERHGQRGAMFLLPNGKRIVTEHYRCDERRISTMLVRRPPEIALLAMRAQPRARSQQYALVLDAKRREIKSLCDIHTFTWHVGDLPDDARMVPGIMVMKKDPTGALKLTKEGNAKARLCLRGDQTPKGQDVPTYAPCASWTAFLIFTAVAAAHGARLLQADVVNAYVQADLHAHPNVPPTFMPLTAELRELLREALPDMPIGERVRCVRVRRALYGLRESARLFNDHFDAVLRGVGFELLGGEPCLYIYRCENGFLLLCLHVDDFLQACCGASPEEFDRVHNAIRAALNNLLKTATPEVFVGTDYFTIAGGDNGDSNNAAAIHRTSSGIHISVSAHIRALFARAMPHDHPPSATDTRVPLAESLYRRLARREGEPIALDDERAVWYRSVRGVVIWVASRCRPDIAFASHFLSRGVGAPTTVHITAAIHLLRYLHSTHSHGLLFRIADGGAPPPVERELVIYHDATFAGDPSDSSSVAAFVVFLNGTPVDWHVKRVPYVARSSTDAELYGADNALRFIEDHEQLLRAVAQVSSIMRKLIPDTTAVATDNSGLERLANNVNDGEPAGQRHIRTRIHHLKEAIRAGQIRLKWVSADDMHADILTKCVSVPRFESMRAHQVQAAPTIA